jgi:hypothetical protein
MRHPVAGATEHESRAESDTGRLRAKVLLALRQHPAAMEAVRRAFDE